MISIAKKICLAYVPPKNVLLRSIYGTGTLLRSCLTCLLSEIRTEGQTILPDAAHQSLMFLGIAFSHCLSQNILIP